MNSFARSHEIEEPSGLPTGRIDESRDAVLSELERILASRFFKSAERSKQFLRYVVEHKLAGHPDQLKERTIGTEVFLRPPGYSTGDDPVVRVQAGEVRRRIEQYYQGSPDSSPVRIQLPVGSYSPAFLWPSTPAFAEKQVPAAAAVPAPVVSLPIAKPAIRNRWRFWAIAAACLALALTVGIAFRTVHHTAAAQQPANQTTLGKFWNPVFASQQPAVICLGASSLRPLGKNVQDTGSKTLADTYLGAPVRDVYAAVTISKLLDQIGKPSQMRIGSNCSLDDLRNSAAVAVGGYNNKLTMQLIASSHLAIVHDKGLRMVRELPPGNRVWQAYEGSDGEGNDDFAVVSRQLDSKTGQLAIAVTGTGPLSTQAASDFVSNPQYLEQGLRNAPADWTRKNLAIVLETMGTDSVAGPPHVVASYFW